MVTNTHREATTLGKHAGFAPGRSRRRPGPVLSPSRSPSPVRPRDRFFLGGLIDLIEGRTTQTEFESSDRGPTMLVKITRIVEDSLLSQANGAAVIGITSGMRCLQTPMTLLMVILLQPPLSWDTNSESSCVHTLRKHREKYPRCVSAAAPAS